MKIKRNIKNIACAACLFFIGMQGVVAASYSRLNIDSALFESDSTALSVSFPQSEDSVGKVEVVFSTKDRSGVFWAGKIENWEERQEDNRRIIDLVVPVEQMSLGILVDAQINVYDIFDRIISQGRGSFENPRGGLFKPLNMSGFSYDSETEVASFSAETSSEENGITIEVRSESLSGDVLKTFYKKPSKKNRDGSFLFEQQVPDLAPGKYYLFIRNEGEGNKTPWGPQLIIQKGDILRIYGTTPDSEQMLPEDQSILPFYMEGYVPPKKNYQLLGNIEQIDASGNTISEGSSVVEEVLYFEDHERFVFEKGISINSDAEKIEIDLEIVSGVRNEEGLSKKIIYRRLGGETPQEPEAVIPPETTSQAVPLEETPNAGSNVNELRWVIYALIGVILVLLILMKYKGRYLKGLIIFLASSAVFSSVYADEIGGYDETIVARSSTFFLNPSSLASGFNTLPVTLLVEDNAPLSTQTLFEDITIDMTDVVISFKKSGDSTYTDTTPIDAQDVFLTESNPSISGYDTLYADVGLGTYSSLSDGIYDVKIRVNFDSSDWVEAEYLDYFYIDETPPVVSVSPISTDPAAYTDYTLSCGPGETVVCVTPEELSSTIRVQGNFCDGTDDTNKICDSSNLLKRTFELCDAADNCSPPTSPGVDFFYYDAFSPIMKKGFFDGGDYDIELRESDSEPLETRASEDEPNKKANSNFQLNLKSQSDERLDLSPDNTDAGAGADPNMCGDLDEAGLCRDYDDDGNPISCSGVANRSPLYFGPDGEGSGSTICRQRETVCSNGPGHRGVWDRSVVSTDFFRCHDGETIPAPNCEVGYTLDSGSGVCKKTCGDGYYHDELLGKCEEIKQCDPTFVKTITGVPGVWIYNTGVSRSNQAMTYDGTLNDETGAAACSWGCAEGYVVDNELSPSTCKLFVPTDINSDLKAWMRATSTSIISADGDPIVDGYEIQDDDQWGNDAGGVFYDPYIDSSGDLIYKVDPLGLGNDMVEITDEGAGFESSNNFQVTASEGWTAYYVAQMTNAGSDKRVLNAEIPENGSFGFVYCDSGSDKGPRINGIYLQGGKPNAECSSPATKGTSPSYPELEELQMFGVIRYADGSLDLRNQDGSIQTFTGTSSHSYDWTINQGKFAASKVGSTFLMGEMVVYDKAISNTDRDDLEAYLKNKWDLWSDEDIVKADAEKILAGIELYKADNGGDYPREFESGRTQFTQWNTPNCSANQSTGSTNSDPTGIYDRPNGIRLSTANGWANDAGKTLSDYITIPLDPWGEEYIIDSVYNCSGNTSPGCLERTNGSWVWAIHSGGANTSNPNAYDADNIVYLVCDHAN